MTVPRFRALFSDIGGVLGTNGWDASLRKRIADRFAIELGEIDARHHLLFDSYERGYMGFEDYLRGVFFSVPRAFTLEEIRDYTYDASIPWTDNIQFLKRVKAVNRLKLALISNEGRGIADHRVGKFGLRELADFLVISHFVHFRKPDPEIWRLALNLAQATPEESVYIDDREMFVGAAADIGFTSIQHVSLENTRDQLSALGMREE